MISINEVSAVLHSGLLLAVSRAQYLESDSWYAWCAEKGFLTGIYGKWDRISDYTA